MLNNKNGFKNDDDYKHKNERGGRMYGWGKIQLDGKFVGHKAKG